MDNLSLVELNTNFKKINNYLTNLHKLLITYIKELQYNLDSKELLHNLENIINTNEFDKYNKNLSNISIIKIEFYLNLLYSKQELDSLLILINKISIYDEKTLLSDTSKNTINSNKLAIQQLSGKIETKYNLFISTYINYFTLQFNFTDEKYIEITNFYTKNTIIIDLYIDIIRNYLHNQNISAELKNRILYNNSQLENNLMTKELENINIKCNNNSINDFNYLFKSNINNLKLNNIIDKYQKYSVSKSYDNLDNLIRDVFSYNNIKNKSSNFINNTLDSKNLKYIHQILDEYYKIEKKYIGIILIESIYDDINYNLVNLLNDKYKLENNQGVTNQYINKTKTIIQKDEIFTLPELDSNYQNDIYINNIQNINVINNYKLSTKLTQSDKESLLFNTDFLFIYINKSNKKHTKNNIHIMSSKIVNNNNIFMRFLDIKILLQNKVNYDIETYKYILENSILQNINKNNMLELYNTKISEDYSNLPKLDNLELKNNIINKLKKIKLKENTTQENKIKNRMENIDIFINAIIDEIYAYIIKINNIELSSEIYLTYYSNISLFINKIKKELHDKYDNNILLNIDNILDNIYGNIITINNNILDKSYLIKL